MLSDRLRSIRKEKKLTQEQLALLVNTKKTTISNYETGYSTPSNEMLSDLADVLGVSVDYLLGRKQKNEQTQPLTTILNIENLDPLYAEILDEFKKLDEAKKREILEFIKFKNRN